MFDYPPEDIAGVEDDWPHDSWEKGMLDMLSKQILWEIAHPNDITS